MLAMFPSAASAAVTIGSDLSPNPVNAPCSGGNCTVANLVIPGRQIVSPIDGVVVRWTVRDSNIGVNARLRVIQPLSGGTYQGISSSATHMLPSPGGSSFATISYLTQQPIKAGQIVALDLDGPNTNNIQLGTNVEAGASEAVWDPALLGSPSAPTSTPNAEFTFNADVVAPPTSSASACAASHIVTATVTPDPDPATAAKAIHYRIDGGAEQAVATTGSPGTASVTVPAGRHSLEYWAEDQLGQLEVAHHTVICKPPNAFTLGKAKSNKNGTATLTVNVPYPGELAASGNGVKSASAARAQAAKTVTAPGAVQLLIKAAGKKRKKLNATGKVKVTANVIFTPTGGDPSTQSTKLKLKKR
jgi:hypothetical protein